MKGFKSKFFIIALCVALLLSIVPSVLCLMGQATYVRSAISTVTYPLRWCFNEVGEGLSGFSRYFKKLSELEEENERLREELLAVRGELYDADVIERENLWLREYLELKDEKTDLSLLDASVIGCEAGNYTTVYTLSKGSMHGIRRHMPIITAEGLVGYVTEVGPTSCRAVTVTETATAVGAYINRTGDTGIVSGEYSLRFDGLCQMKEIPADSEVRIGDKIYTSGIGSIYPRGLLIGTVTWVEVDPYTRTKTATVRPSAPMEGLSKVMVVVDFDIYME